MENIFTVVRPLYLVTKVLGLFPMSFNGLTEKGNFVVKHRDFVAPILNVFLAICLVPLIILYPLEVESFSPMMSTTLHLIGISGTILNFIPFSYQIYKRKSINRMLRDFHDFDKKVRKLFEVCDYHHS